MATKKRTVDDAAIEAFVPSTKRRKLNQDKEQSSSLQTIPLSTESPSASVATNLSSKINQNATSEAITPPLNNPEVNNVNIETKHETQNDHTAKKSLIKKDQDKKSNDDVSAWCFADNSWVQQSSSSTNDTQTTTDSTAASPKPEVLPNQDSFSAFAGLGFQKHLDDQNSKEVGLKEEDKNTKASEKDTQTKKEAADPWKSAWSNSNPDGTFKLNFNWGNWKDDNANIDLNPSTKLGWGSTAPVYDPNAVVEDDTSKQVVEQMGGKQDTGDADDDVKYKVHCKVYNLESGRYVERGKGILKLNTYALEDKEVKGRILCRRDQTLTTLINAPILKKMNFEKAGSYLRFGVLEIAEIKEENEDDENVKKESSVKEEDKGEKEKDVKGEDEDDDMKTEIKTYLIRPTDKTQLDVLLKKIKDIQKQIG